MAKISVDLSRLKEKAPEAKANTLKASLGDNLKGMGSVNIDLISPIEIKVVFSGVWNGRMLRGAVRALERQYKAIKHTVTRDAIYAEAARRREAERMRGLKKKENGDARTKY